MAYNLRLAFDYATTKAGHDSNVASGNFPLNSINALMTKLGADAASTEKIGVIGEGIYKENIDLTMPLGVRTIKADGRVKFRATGANKFYLNQGNTNFHDIVFEDYVQITVFGGSSYSMTFYGCTFINCTINKPTQAAMYFYNCTFINCVFTGSITRIEGCKLLEGTRFTNAPASSYASSFISNDVDASSSFTILVGRIGSNDLSYSNVRGTLRSSSNTFGYTDLATFLINYPTAANSGLFSADPEYLAPMLGVYLVGVNSPNIKTGFASTNIGNVKTAKGVFLDTTVNGDDSLDPDNPDVIIEDSLQVLGNAASVKAGQTVGYIESDWILVNNGRQVTFAGLEPSNNMEFNTSFVAPHIENMNVLDSDNGTAHPDNVFGSPTYELSASRNPNNLTYQMMWSSLVTKPVDYSQGDNSGFLPAGTWGKFRWFKRAQIDSNGVSNGEINFNWQQVAPFSEPLCRWVKFRIWMRNDYTS